ncbi:hypothetical protein A2W14_06365 [Candidatus Gottesmanbacteria bacterium RBG_16_37_8]|uniref:Uncharacterized protein n=1 Tax=Candidatus Gottesmanbacteria bacterium RBG_16_37_8 TaxID=1798371 RepID=A0A1F5YPM6_9BACT|nr:MAG: hypothetical protein A2W14_06365 [Candidatus Gottesmanbacteria bacterium RBG_16_37_8]
MKRRRDKYRKLVFFLLLAIFIFYINFFVPGSFFSVVVFYFLLFLFLLSFLSLFLGNNRSIRFSSSFIILLALRHLKQFNLLNFLIILSINILLEVYFRKSKTN